MQVFSCDVTSGPLHVGQISITSIFITLPFYQTKLWFLRIVVCHRSYCFFLITSVWLGQPSDADPKVLTDPGSKITCTVQRFCLGKGKKLQELVKSFGEARSSILHSERTLQKVSLNILLILLILGALKGFCLFPFCNKMDLVKLTQLSFFIVLYYLMFLLS